MLQFTEYTTSLEKLMASLKGDGQDIDLLFTKLSERKVYIGDTGIARNNLHHWMKNDLLPYKDDNEGWQKFSIIEFTWLKIINTLRNLGVSLEKIKQIKEQLFNVNVSEFKELILHKLNSVNVEITDRQDVINFYNNANITNEQWKMIFDSLQISEFSILLFQILIFNQNICIVIDDVNKCYYVAMGNVEEKKKINESNLSELVNSSFVLINVRKIIREFFSSDKVLQDNDYAMGFLNKSERTILGKIQAGKVKEIKIFFSDKKPMLLNLIKTLTIEDAKFEMTRIMNGSGYRKIEMKLNDDKVLYFEQTDFIKLD